MSCWFTLRNVQTQMIKSYFIFDLTNWLNSLKQHCSRSMWSVINLIKYYRIKCTNILYTGSEIADRWLCPSQPAIVVLQPQTQRCGRLPGDATSQVPALQHRATSPQLAQGSVLVYLFILARAQPGLYFGGVLNWGIERCGIPPNRSFP